MGLLSKFPELESKVIVDEEVKRIFRITLRKHYFNQNKNSLPFAYKMMVREFFAKKYSFEDGQEKIKINDTVSIPSINQLRYFLNTEYNEHQKSTSRVGLNKFERNFRERF